LYVVEQFLTVVAGATTPFRRWNTTEDTRPDGRDGSDMRKALNVALVLLTADGIVPLNTPMRMLFWAASGSMQWDVCLLGGHPRHQAVLSLLT
jgi:hypothetical protein